MPNWYQQEAYDPTDDIIMLIDGEESEERTNAPSSHDILLTHDESPLQDRSTYEKLIEQHSMGAVFLKAIATDTVQRVRSVDVPGLSTRIDNSQWTSLMRQYAYFTMDPFQAECPQFVLSMANSLSAAKVNDEMIQDLLCWKDPDGRRRPKWPNSFSAISLLLAMAQRNQDDEEVINLLADQNGNMRFPGHKGAIKMLTHSYRKTNQPTKVTELLDSIDPENDIWKEEDVCRQYIQALNLTERSNDAIEKFTRGDRVIAQCPISYGVIANLANAFNLGKRHREACFILGRWIHHADARENKFFATVASIAMSNMGMHREVIALLAERSGRCRFPDSAAAVRALIYAFINTDHTPEAEQLLRGAVREDVFTGDELMAIENAFERKCRSNLQGKW